MANRSDDRLGFCPRCGEYLKEEMTICPKCGLVIREAIPPLEPVMSHPTGPPASTRAMIGAACLVLSGLIGLTMSSFVMINRDAIVSEISSIYGGDIANVQEAVTFLVVFWLLAGIMASVGGFFAGQRRHFKVAMLGGFFALGTFGLIFLEGSLMGLIGLIMVWLSRREFR